MCRQSAAAPRPPPSLVVKASPVPHPWPDFDACGVCSAAAIVESPPHAVDVADGMEHGWTYVDNVKSGSTSVAADDGYGNLVLWRRRRRRLHAALQRHVDGAAHVLQHGRPSLLAAVDAVPATGRRRALLLFSFVRPCGEVRVGPAPVLSRRPWSREAGRCDQAAGGRPPAQRAPTAVVVELCGADADGQFLPLDYVGRRESPEEDQSHRQVDARSGREAPQPLHAAIERRQPSHGRQHGALSDEGRRLFCRSGLYGEEHAFLRRLGVPYELPSACAN